MQSTLARDRGGNVEGACVTPKRREVGERLECVPDDRTRQLKNVGQRFFRGNVRMNFERSTSYDLFHQLRQLTPQGLSR